MIEKTLPAYVPYLRISYNALNFTLLLGQHSFHLGPETTDGGPLWTGAIAIPAITAKVLLKDLTAAVEAYERENGPIRDLNTGGKVVSLRAVGDSTEPAISDDE